MYDIWDLVNGLGGLLGLILGNSNVSSQSAAIGVTGGGGGADAPL